ncbi:hypothetical protein GOP47_0009878, partial [Adiantum capillus-veneris]
KSLSAMQALLQRQWRCCSYRRSQRPPISELQAIPAQSSHGDEESSHLSTCQRLLASDQKILVFADGHNDYLQRSFYMEKKSSLLVQETQGGPCGRRFREFCHANNENYVHRPWNGFMVCWSNLPLREFHTTAETLEETEAVQTVDDEDELAEQSESDLEDESEHELEEESEEEASPEEQLEADLSIYKEMKEYVETRHGNRPELMELLNEYNPLAEMKEPSIAEFRPPDRALPPLDRVTIALDTNDQYRVTRKTKWVTKQLRSPIMNDVPALLEQWVKTMYPKRSDWLDLLKEFSKDEKEQALLFQIFEFALFEDTFEVRSQDLQRILAKYINLERYDDVDRLTRTLDDKCFPPDFVACTLLLDMNCKLKRLDKAKEMFDGIRSMGYMPDLGACNKLIEFYCETGNPEEGETLLAEMEEEKLHSSVDTYLTVLNGYGKQGKAAEALKIFSIMNDDAFLRPQMGSDVYSALMNAYIHSNLLPSAVLKMEDMMNSGFSPPDESVSMLIAAFEKKNQFQRAVDVLLKLESMAIRPGVETLTTLIGWFGKLGLIEEAETLFENLKEKVNVPDCKAYASLFSVYARAGSIDKAKALLATVEGEEVEIDASAYELMIVSLLDGKDREEAQSMRDRMIAQGLIPSDEVERALLGIQADSFLAGVSKPSEGATQSLGIEAESFLAGVSKRAEEAPETL